MTKFKEYPLVVHPVKARCYICKRMKLTADMQYLGLGGTNEKEITW